MQKGRFTPTNRFRQGCLQNEDRRSKTEDRRPKNEDPNFFARIRHGQLKNQLEKTP